MSNPTEPILVTGAAGFIGFHVARRLLAEGRVVVGVDNLNPYYAPDLKRARLAILSKFPAFQFDEIDLSDRDGAERLFAAHRFPLVVHLAAQAGVRYSLTDPHTYVESNLTGFLNVLEGCRHGGCRHLIYASSSSVYGANVATPFAEAQPVDHPVNLYGATKRANELMAHAYAHLFAMPTTGLRFFTVYGPWGRPDMAVWLFAEAIRSGKPLRLFGGGEMRRDFTYIDDVVEVIIRLLGRVPAANPGWSARDPDPSKSAAPWCVYNVGNHEPVKITRMVELLEKSLARSAARELLPMQPGEMVETCADVSSLDASIGFVPHTPIEKGVDQFVSWYLEYVKSS
jgi:UDP-glucuronate 4-epimerase